MTSPLPGLDEPSRMSNRSVSVMAAQPPSHFVMFSAS